MAFVWIALGIFVYLLIGAFFAGWETDNNDDRKLIVTIIVFWPIVYAICLPIIFYLAVIDWSRDIHNKRR